MIATEMPGQTRGIRGLTPVGARSCATGVARLSTANGTICPGMRTKRIGNAADGSLQTCDPERAPTGAL